MKSIGVFKLFVLVFLYGSVFGQPIELEWEKQMGSPSTDMFTDVIEDINGGFTVLGATFNDLKKNIDNWLVRFDADGKVIWTETFGSDNYDCPLHFAQCNNGNYVLAGKIQTDNVATGVILKVDTLGKLIWTKEFGNKNCYCFEDVIVLENKNIIAAGTLYDENQFKKGLLVQLNPKGEIIWEKSINKMDQTIPKSLKKLPDGGFALASKIALKNSLDSDLYVIRFNADGEIIWDFHQKKPNIQIWPECICCTPDNNLMVSGWHGSCMNDINAENPVFDFDLFITKISPEGKVIWNKNIDSEGSEGGYAIAIRPDGKILLAGRKETSFLGRIGPWILLTDEKGEMISELVPPIIFNADKAARLINSSDGGFLVIGPGEVEPNTTRSDGWIKKFKAF